MLPQRESSVSRVPTGSGGADAARPAHGVMSVRSTTIETTTTYFHRSTPQFEIDEAWLAAASWYEDAMAQLVLRQPGAVERVRAAAQALQALQALTVAQAVDLGPDDIAA
jgi:hypothetical protein